MVGLMFCRISEGLLNPSDLKHTVPTFSSFAPTPLGLRHSPRTFVGIGSQQEVDFAREKKENSGCQWKEGASIAQKTSGECVLWPELPVSYTVRKGIQPDFREGRYALCSLKMKLLLLASQGRQKFGSRAT